MAKRIGCVTDFTNVGLRAPQQEDVHHTAAHRCHCLHVAEQLKYRAALVAYRRAVRAQLRVQLDLR